MTVESELHPKVAVGANLWKIHFATTIAEAVTFQMARPSVCLCVRLVIKHRGLRPALGMNPMAASLTCYPQRMIKESNATAGKKLLGEIAT